jgi:HEAT repeat protein
LGIDEGDRMTQRELLQALAGDVVRALVLGSGGAETLLSRQRPALQQLAGQVPMLSGLASGLTRLAEGTPEEGAKHLLDLLVMSRWIVAGMLPAGLAGELCPVPIGESWTTALGAEAIYPLLTPSSQGCGLVLVYRDWGQLPDDLRLVGPALRCLEAPGFMPNHVARDALPRFGRAIIPDLLGALDLQGGAADAGRLTALCHIDPTAAADVCVRAVREGGSAVRKQALEWLSRVGDAERMIPVLISALDDPHEDAGVAVTALVKWGAAAVPAVTAALTAPTDRTRVRACKALGQIGPEAAAAVPTLLPLLSDSTAEVRSEAARAIGRIGMANAEVIGALVAAVRSHPGAGRRWPIDALLLLGADTGVVAPVLLEAVRDRTGQGRAEAMDALIGLEAAPEMIVSALCDVLGDPEDAAPRDALEAVKALGPVAAATGPALLAILRGQDEWLALSALRALEAVELVTEDVVRALWEAVLPKRTHLSAHAAITLGHMSSRVPAVVSWLSEALAGKDATLQAHAALGLSFSGPHAATAVPALLKVARARKAELRSQALEALLVVAPDDPRVVGALTGALQDRSSGVRDAALDRLQRLGAPAAGAVPELIALMTNHSGPVPDRVVRALGSMGPAAAAAVPVLTKELQIWAIPALATALAQIGGPLSEEERRQAGFDDARAALRATLLKPLSDWESFAVALLRLGDDPAPLVARVREATSKPKWEPSQALIQVLHDDKLLDRKSLINLIQSRLDPLDAADILLAIGEAKVAERLLLSTFQGPDHSTQLRAAQLLLKMGLAVEEMAAKLAWFCHPHRRIYRSELCRALDELIARRPDLAEPLVVRLSRQPYVWAERQSVQRLVRRLRASTPKSPPSEG